MAVQTHRAICSVMADDHRNLPVTWNPVCHITYTRDTWVKLLEKPSSYASDEAKLICQESPNTWLTWVPDYGQLVVDKSLFYCH